MGRLCDPVGTVEIVERLNVTRAAVNAWRHRDMGFPAPRWKVGGRPAWNWDEIKTWVDTRPGLRVKGRN
jgi:hypothetical protein